MLSKTKMLMPVLAVLLVLGFANSAYAQLSCSVASTPVSRTTESGHTEVAGDLIFNCAGGAVATTAATITVDYGVTITNSTTYPIVAAPFIVAKPIGIVNLSGSFAVPANSPTIGVVSNGTGQIVINVPGQAAPPAAGSFTLTGVLVSLAGTGRTSLTANVSVSPGNNVLITAGQNVATVITSVLPGLQTPSVTAGPAILLASGNVQAATSTFSVRVRENYIDMLRDSTEYNGGAASNDTQLLLTFAGIPTGITLGGCGVVGSVPIGATGVPTLSAATITSASPTLTVSLGAGMNLNEIDTIVVTCTTITVGGTASIPLTPGTVTATVTLAPTGSALSSAGAVLTATTTGQIPRYASNPLPATPLTVLTIVPAQTNLLIPFSVVAGTYDTGIAIANTTTDPYGTAAGAGGAAPHGGNITFTFYPQTGSSFSYSTAAGSPGTGLSATGALTTGRTYSVLASELIRAASGPANFTGYIFAVTNFTHAHGQAYVTNFAGFTAATNVLVLPPPALAANSRALATVEALNH